MKRLYVFLVITILLFTNSFSIAYGKMIKQENSSFPPIESLIEIVNSDTICIAGKSIRVDSLKIKIKNFLVEELKEWEKLTPKEKKVIEKIAKNLQNKFPIF